MAFVHAKIQVELTIVEPVLHQPGGGGVFILVTTKITLINKTTSNPWNQNFALLTKKHVSTNQTLPYLAWDS